MVRAYIVPFYYSVEKDGQVSSICDFPPEMEAHTATVEQFEILISKALKKSHPSRRRHELGAVLFTDEMIAHWLAGRFSKVQKSGSHIKQARLFGEMQLVICGSVLKRSKIQNWSSTLHVIQRLAFSMESDIPRPSSSASSMDDCGCAVITTFTILPL